MKKIFLLFFLPVLLAGLTSCGQKQDSVSTVYGTSAYYMDTSGTQTSGTANAPGVGSRTAEGYEVTGVAADGSTYVAVVYDEAGRIAQEYTYSGYTNTAIFRADYTYDADGLPTAKNAVALADKAFGYVPVNGGSAVPCSQMYSEYNAGQETYLFYRDCSGNEVALVLTDYDTDGGYVTRTYEYGTIACVCRYDADGTLQFRSTDGTLTVGARINLGGDRGLGYVSAIDAEGNITVQYTGQTHSLTDGNTFHDLELYTVLNNEYLPVTMWYALGSTELCRYEITYNADRSYTEVYSEYGKTVCTLSYDRTGMLSTVANADGTTFDPNEKREVGDAVGDGMVCQVGEDGSFVLCYLNRTYKTLSGQQITGTTMYAFYTLAGKLQGNKYYSDGSCIAEYDVLYNEDGTYKINIFESGVYCMTVKYDKTGKAVSMTKE